MIRHERPGKTLGSAFDQKIGKTGNKMSLISVIRENIASFNSSYNAVMQDVWYVKTRLAWHELKLAFF
jgi:hypothetical protein